MNAAAPPSFLCPIGHAIMIDPVTCTDGHSYERANIERWFLQHTTSPATGAVLPDLALTPNHALRKSAEEWLVFNFKLVPRSAVRIDGADALAVGRSFKEVQRGTLDGHDDPIAVLRLRQGGSCEEEAGTLVQLGRHAGLVRYLGLCADGPEQLLLTELATFGSLDQFLENHEGEMTFAHRLTALRQVCAGMVALNKAGLVHRDLAARNVLVFAFDASDPAATVVKITGFGLAAERHYRTHGTAQGKGVPFRWMPPEALRRRRFSEKSDVWAFGVTAWEILTGGDVPFAFVDANEAVARRICGGERLERPAECPDAMWTLLRRTWAERPEDRPSFAEISGELARIGAGDASEISSWSGVRDALDARGYPRSACLACTPFDPCVTKNVPFCFHASRSTGVGDDGLCSACGTEMMRRHVAGLDRLEVGPFRQACKNLGGAEGMDEDAKRHLDSAWPFTAFMPAAQHDLILRTIIRRHDMMTPQRLANMLDEFEDRGFLSAAQAALLLQALPPQNETDYKYWHVICSRILDRWNTNPRGHGIGDCYHGWGSNPSAIHECAFDRVGAPNSHAVIRRNIMAAFFRRDNLLVESFNARTPGFFVALLARIKDHVVL